MALSSLAENQTLQSLQFGLRRLISATRVLMVVSDERLVLCWQQSGAWHWSAGTWPADSCRGGQPQLREGMSELLADLLLKGWIDVIQLADLPLRCVASIGC